VFNAKQYAEVSSDCARRLQSAELDSIRNSVELDKNQADTPPRFFENQSLASGPQVGALKIWAQDEYDCYHKKDAVCPADDQSRARVTSDLLLIPMLYTGELTFGRFAQLRQTAYAMAKTDPTSSMMLLMQQDLLIASQVDDSHRHILEVLAALDLVRRRLDSVGSNIEDIQKRIHEEQDNPHHYVFMNRKILCTPNGETLACSFE
jgi:hypothetical protein